MIILEHKSFQKKVAKLSPRIQKQLKSKLHSFFGDPMSPMLNNHALHGDFVGCRSINITGDLRLIYKIIDDTTILFIDVGTHSNLYQN